MITYGYSLTVKYSPTGDEQNAFQFETLEVEACNGESQGCQSLLPRQFVTLKEISVFDVKRKGDLHSTEIVRLTKDVDSTVCLCSMPGQGDINAVQRLAVTGGAKALLVMRKPTEMQHVVPVFVVKEDLLLKWSNYKCVTISFQQHDNRQVTSPKTGEEAEDAPTITEHNEKFADPLSLPVDPNPAPNGPPAYSPTSFPDADPNDAVDLLQMDSARETSGLPGNAMAGGHSSPIDLLEMDTSKDVNYPTTFSAGDLSTPNDLLELDSGGSDGSFIGQFADACGVAGSLPPQEDVNANRPPRYTVTLSSTDSNVVEVFQVEAVDATRTLVAPDFFYGVVQVKPYRRPWDEKIVDFMSPSKGRVCLYREPHLGDINQVQAIAAEQGAVALFVLLKPSCTLSGDLPVFQLTDTLMDKLWSMRSPEVAFNLDAMPQKVTSSSQSSDVDPTSPLCAGAVGTTYSQSSDEDQADQPSASNSSPDSDNLRQNSSFSQAASGDVPKSKGGGFFNGLAKAVEFFIGKEHIFEPQKGNGLTSNQMAYSSALKKINKALQTGNGGLPESMISDAEKFLTRKTWILGHLVAAAYICNRVSMEAGRKLQSIVLGCIANVDVSKGRLEVLEPSRKSQLSQPPHQVMYTFLTGRVTELTNSIAPGDSVDIRLFKALVILNSCGLCRKSFERPVWVSLGKSIDSSFFERNMQGRLKAAVGPDRAQSLQLCCQSDLHDFLDSCLGLKQPNSRIHVEPFVHNMLLLFIDQQFDCDSNATDTLSAWNMCMRILDLVSFGFRDVEARSKIISHFLKQAWRLGGRPNFDTLSQMFVSVTPSHYDYLRVKRQVVEVLTSDLKADKFELPALTYLLSLPVGKLLGSRDALEMTNKFVESAMSRWSSLKDKLLLVDLLYKKFVGENWIADSWAFVRRTIQHVLDAINSEPSVVAALSKCLCIAAEVPGLFVLTNRETEAWKAVADAVMSDNRAREIVHHPDLLEKIPDSDDGEARLYHYLLQRVHNAVLSQCKTIDEAAQFYDSTVNKVPSASLPFQRIADHIFSACFRRWNPAGMMDFEPKHKTVIDIMFSESSAESDTVADTRMSSVAACRVHVKNIVEQWMDLYTTNNVTRVSLQDALRSLNSQIWKKFEAYYSLQLPTFSELKEKLDRICSLETGIQASLSVSVGDQTLPLKNVLREYNCIPDKTGPLDYLLKYYSYLFSESDDRDGQNELKQTRTLREMTDDYRVASDLASTNYGMLRLCGFFLIFRSRLFREAVLQKNGQPHTVETLDEAVAEAKLWLRSVFGPCSLYGEIVAAMKILRSSKADDAVDSEVTALAKCEELQISSVDIDYFRVGALLFETSVPIQHFILCCDQFGFAITSTDSNFVALRLEVGEFYGNQSNENTVDKCLDFFRCLCRFLCPDAMLGYPSTSDQYEALLTVVPLLQLLATISQYPELWTYASEMEWFGEDGLKRFYEEYGNVTNVLLGDSASYEMSLLDAMEPAMRLISAIGNLRETTNMLALFECFKANPDIVLGLNGDLEHYVRQVHSKLSEIKDWFSNGVDEVAAAHSVYGAASTSGHYVFTEQDDVETSRAHEQVCVQQDQLTLQFTIDNADTREDRRLQGEALNQFIQQLSLIQNESSGTSAEMMGFVDQYHLLSSASRKMSTMRAVGYEKLSISAFSCRAGGAFIEDASLLLKQSESHMRNFKSWLQSTREIYKVSTLFFTEELKALHKLVQAVCCNEAETGILVQRVARLQPLWNRDIDEMRGHAIVQSSLATFRNRTEAESKSWLIEVSQLLADIHREMGGAEDMPLTPSRSNVVLHSLCCGDDDEPQSVLAILQHIYKDRLPLSFEILDGAVPCSLERLALFLDRVKAFTSCRFVVLNTEKLESKNLEQLLSFLSDREIASLGISFHCIQRGDGLHTSPWVSGMSWDGDSLAIAAPDSDWNTRVLDCVAISSVTVTASPTCGSGKTRFIREELNKFISSEIDAQAASIVVHEKSSVRSLVQALKSKFSGTSIRRALHVSFTFMPKREKRHEKWLLEMNHFFLSLLVLRSVYDPVSASSFSLASEKWKFFFEMPEGSTCGTAKDWLVKNIPIVAFCGTFVSPSRQYIIDHEARRVCTYLRAFETGTINRKFEGGARKRIVLVLDCSGSMAGRPFQDAVTNAVGIFDSRVVEGDEFGVTLFNGEVYVPVPVQTVGVNTDDLRRQIQQLPFYSGGTEMYHALSNALLTLSGRDQSIESWVVCLTDGESGSRDHNVFRPQLMATPASLHMVVVGINLKHRYEEHLHEMCRKYTGTAAATETKGFFVRSDGTTAGITGAFDVVKSKIPVSQTFDRDGAMSDDECRGYMARYLPSFIAPDDMISQAFWIRFLYRRVKVFDANESFNYNETHDALGSSLLEVMLSEVERLLSENHRRDWLVTNHAQLIYDFTNPTAPEFRLICTSPDELDVELRQKLVSLDLPGFHIPTKAELDCRDVLLLFLSQALDVPLQAVAQCIDEHGFILTLDFTMKLLNIHERVACGVPCLLEGETGVSKTALTKMYSILRNSSLAQKASASTLQDLNEIEQQLRSEGFTLGNATSSTALERLRESISDNANDVAIRALTLIQQKAMGRSPLFVALPSPNGDAESAVQDALETLELFSSAALERTFFEINVDASLTERDFVHMFDEVRAMANKLSGSDAAVVLFLDEVNTSSVLGLLKEATIDGSIAGELLEKNIVVVAACNPPRSQLQSTTRERDLGRDWASGHYQVAKLPASMIKLKWSFGSLTHSQEKEFIHRRIEALHRTMPPFLKASLTEVISRSHQLMRVFAKRNILNSLHRTQEDDTENIDIETEAQERSQSIVSLRDIQRVFSLYEFFFHDLEEESKERKWRKAEQQRRAMLLAVATVYYLRLDSSSRDEFLDMISVLPTEVGQNIKMLDVLNHAMDTVIQGSDIPSGIAITRGLKENVFVTLVCSLSQTPLMIVGPPGSSKTLAVNMVADNATGTDSISPFYGKRPRLSLFHYQCSKQSTSKEISAVFDQAIQRQERFDVTKHRCVVFMDEAGLPEEEKESLKVLHYLLEGHMSAKARVGFVAISNHVLDAAKSNRCVMLLRQDPDDEEMLSIATGVLFNFREDGRSCAHDVDIDGALLPAGEFATKLCKSYASLFQPSSPVSQLRTFFGLRDFIYFLKAVRLGSKSESTRLYTSVQAIIYAIERNFNGITGEELRQVSACFLKLLPFPTPNNTGWLESSFRDPMMVLKDALAPATSYAGQLNRPRFKLIIDCTEDDSILRLLSIGEVAEVTKRTLYKLSNLPENVDLERLRLISGVKFAALQGNFAVLSQTEPINESFYDLFNQRFREITGREGNVTLYANIAVGGISRRSLVRPEFECVVHIRESNMQQIPAPFLNRFEKYRLTLSDVLSSGWSNFGLMAGIVTRARKRTSEIASIFGSGGGLFSWIASRQTLESIFVDMLPHLDKRMWSGEHDTTLATFCGTSTKTLCNLLTEFLEHATSLRGTSIHVNSALQLAQETLAVDLADYLTLLVHGEILGSVVHECLRSILLSSKPGDTQMSGILATLVQMALTRSASCRLIQLATPELIFTNRHILPPDMIHEYFEQQEHFSLKRLLARRERENFGPASLTVVHTRSDQFIHRIPSLPADREISSEEPETIETVLNLVHDQPHSVVIEHINRLRSEASVRGAIQAWAQHDTRNVFLLLLDMSQECCLDRANYIRMCVEQHLPVKRGKSFTLLLHYSPSSSLSSRCYPALCLGGWEHVFLDSVGNDSSSFDVDQFIALACRSDDPSSVSLRLDDESTRCVHESIKALLPRILPYVASQKFFYLNQLDTPDQDTFYHRKSWLDAILRTVVGDATVGDIICRKFSAMWFESALLQTTRAASESLLCGTTQLSLSMSIRSVLIQAFQVFLCDSLAETNQWMNLDLIRDSSLKGDILKLFGLVLRDLPVLPFEELVLQRKQNARLIPLPAWRVPTAGVEFPFFYRISTYLDELVESVQESYIRENGPPNPDDILPEPLSTMDCLRMAMDVIQYGDSRKALADDDATSRNQEWRKLAQAVIAFVADNARAPLNGGLSLFNRYLRQFVEWKVGSAASPVVVRWWEGRLGECSAAGSILAIHIVARLEQMDWMRVASVVALAEAFADSSVSDKLWRENADTVTPDLLHSIFESLELAAVENDSRCSNKWSMLLTTVSQQATTLAGPSIQDEKLAWRLRRLGFFFLLVDMAWVPGDSHRFHLVESNGTRSDYSLARLLQSADVSQIEFGERLLTERALQRFLSPLWLKTTRVFLEDDLKFLLECVAGGFFTGSRQQLAVSLVRSASRGHDATLAYGFSVDALLQINKYLVSCENLSKFSVEGNRLCLPQFVPEWLRGQSSVEYQATETTDDFSVFFSEYGHAFDGDLAEVVFSLLLSSFADEATHSTSEELFLCLTREIDSETSLDRQSYTQLSRLRTVGRVQSMRGTPVAAIALSARVVCFIAKIAHEIATSDSCHVLAGVYSDHARAFVDELMSQGGQSWQQFFMFSILRLCGEGTLSAALSTNGLLRNLAWCKAWAEGIPTSRGGAIESLRQAEAELGEATAEENRKAAEHRHCPHCRQTFIVAEVNCGRFVCGQDFHGERRTHGCGQEFRLYDAPPYRPDGAILEPLRARIEDERLKLVRCRHGEELWESARSMSVPPLSHYAKKEHAEKLLLPCVQLLSAIENHENEVSSRKLISLLWDASGISSRLSLLPDLIEFYLWLHGTFRFLVSRDYAFKIAMGELMKEERLRARFDSVRVHHILALWDRVRVGLNAVLAETDQKVHWQCEEVSIPFGKVENAQLVYLLSEGVHPTDGNDFLFLVINETVELYNNFVQRLAAFSSAASEEGNLMCNMEELQPRFMIRGSGSAVKVGAVVPLSKEDLDWVVESSWDSETCTFCDPKLKHMLNLHDHVALIANPLNHLRERFCFRDDDFIVFGDFSAKGIITVNSGYYFANYQDAQLFDEVQQRLSRLDMKIGVGRIRRTFLDNFHGLDYDCLRAMLEGCRSFLDLLGNSQHNSFEAFGPILHDLVDSREQVEQSTHLQAIGFPRLTEPQSRLVLSLDMGQLVELVSFTGYQLASEAYLFSELPLHLTDPLPDDVEEMLATSIRNLGKESGVETVAKQVQEFSRDVLSFYETQLLDVASKTNQCLRVFLSQSNFCDAADPVFAALPSSVTLRHYISLRQCLHQIKLSLLYHSTRSETATRTTANRNNAFTRTTRGGCWLWVSDDLPTSMDGITYEYDEEPRNPSRGQWRLWFEQALPATQTDVQAKEACEEEESEDVAMREAENIVAEPKASPVDREACAAQLLQRWWRRELDLLADAVDFMESESDIDDSQQRNDPDRFDATDDPSSAEQNQRCRTADSAVARSMLMDVTYGNQEDEIRMRQKLNEHSLPQTMADILVQLGVRCVDDIRLLLHECPELLSQFAPLDRVKLKKAFSADDT